MSRKVFITVCVLAIVSSFGLFAEGQAEKEEAAISYPTKPVQLIVPANPGGGTDLGARLVAEYLKDAMDQNVVVTNMPGAGATVGMNHVHDARNDGYTVLYINETVIANKVFGLSDYSLKDDYVVVGAPFMVDTTCLLSKDLKSFDDLKAKAEKEEVVFGAEVGSIQHIIFTAIKEKTGLNMRFVDTGAVAPSLAALEGGHIDLTTAPLAAFKDAYKAGHYSALGIVSSDERSKLAPDIPTMKELGVDILFPKIFILALPPDTPQEIAGILRDGLQEVVENSEFQEKATGYFYKADLLSAEEVLEMEQNLSSDMKYYAAKISK